MNRSIRLLTSILTLALVVSASGPANAVAQAPTADRFAAVANDLVSTLAAAALAGPEKVAATPNAAVLAAPYYGTSTYTSCTPSCDLYARAGTVAVPIYGTDTFLPIWGYSTGTDTLHPVTLPGPTLTVTEGQAATITLHNLLSEPTSLTIPQADGIPDTTGAAPGGTKNYVFPAGALTAGTYLYEAGLTPNGPMQVAMGMYGALVVQPSIPSTNQGEALLVLSEIDPLLNAAPLTFELRNFAPKYWLINGKAYPKTDPIAATAGDKVQLRYVNAGLVHHSMGLVGIHQQVTAIDGNLLTNPRTVTAEMVPAGSTLDTVVTIPTAAPAGQKYALMDAAMRVDNNGVRTTPTSPTSTIAFGGMLTFITLAGTAATGGPTVAVTATPNLTNGGTAVNIAATITPSTGATASAAEYFIDGPGAAGTGCPMTLSGTSASAIIATTGGTAACPSLASLLSGNRTVYVHAQDSLSTTTWGPFGSAVFNLDPYGPVVSGIVLTPSHTNGLVDVSLHATASDAATGGQQVVQAEYFIDVTGTPIPGTGTLMASSTPATDVTLTATILAATVNALAQGSHTISIRAQDSLLNWGALATTSLIVDTTGPNATLLSTNPSPTNGLWGVQGGSTSVFAQRLDATITDPTAGGVTSNVVAAEYFVDTTLADGIGHLMVPLAGQFTGTSAAVYQLLNLYPIAQLTQGEHRIYVHGKDAAGNWGPYSSVALIIDKTGPNISGASVTPNPTAGASTVTLTATATDPANTAPVAANDAPASNVIAAEWFIGADPGAGFGTPITVSSPLPSVSLIATINVSGMTVGDYTLSVRAQDAAHNWGPAASTTLMVTGPSPVAVPPAGPPAGAPAVPPAGPPAGAAPAAPVNAPATLALRAKPSPLQPAAFAIVTDADAYHAQWVAQSAYPTARAGQIAEWVVAFKNTGTAGWYRGILGANAALGSAEPLNNENAERAGLNPGNWQYASRFAVQTTDYVAPGQIGWFVMQVKAPSAPGTYRFAIRPVIDGASWLEDYGVYFDLVVTP